VNTVDESIATKTRAMGGYMQHAVWSILAVAFLVSGFCSIADGEDPETIIALRLGPPSEEDRRLWWLELMPDGQLQEYMSRKLKPEYNDATIRATLLRRAELRVVVIIRDDEHVSTMTLMQALKRINALAPPGKEIKISVHVLPNRVIIHGNSDSPAEDEITPD
jgi:hypothetical protein